jgi:TolA-binding protein
MKKNICLIFIVVSFFFLSGCGSDQYAIEQQYWKAQRRAEKIFNNPDASPPRELAKVVSLFQNFSKRNSTDKLAIEADFNIARLYLVKDEYELARTQLKAIMNKYVKSDAVCAEATFMVGNSYEMEDNWAAALGQYKKIIRDYPLTVRGLSVPVYIAQHYKVKYQPDKMIAAYQEAIAHYRQLSDKYPATPLAFNVDLLVANCYSAIKEWHSAIDTLNSIITKYKGKIKMDAIFLNMALIYNKELKDNKSAKEILNKLIQDYPDSRIIPAAKKLLKEIK